MPVRCAANCCSSNNAKESCKKSKISFHRFPKNDDDLLKQWVSFTKRSNFVPTIYSTLCSLHFEERCFIKDRFTNRRVLKKGSVPTKFPISDDEIKPKRITYRMGCKEFSKDPEEAKEKYSYKKDYNCIVAGCTEYYTKKTRVKFFRFPEDTVNRHLWLAAIKWLKWIPTETSVVCSRHFRKGRPSDGPDSVPNMFKFRPEDLDATKRLFTGAVGPQSENSDYRDELSPAGETSVESTAELQNQGFLNNTSNPDSDPSSDDSSQNSFETDMSDSDRYEPEVEFAEENTFSSQKDNSDLEEDDEDSSIEMEEEAQQQIQPEVDRLEGTNENDGALDKSNEKEHDRVKFFIFPRPCETNEQPNLSEVTHDEALKAAETLLQYMKNQNNTDHADLVIIQGYKKRILQNVKHEKRRKFKT